MRDYLTDLRQSPTAYEILGVHSSAPNELISASYWAIAGDLQKNRATEPEADARLHLLTRVYQSISDPDRRAEYNMSIDRVGEPLTKRPLPRRRFFLLRLFRRNRYSVNWYVDPHEVLGLHPSAPQRVVPEAHRIMREVYLRLPPGSRRQETLLDLLDASYAVLGDPRRRSQLAGVGQTEEQELPPPARDDPPLSDLQESSQFDVAEATIEPPLTDPAAEESPGRPQTQLRTPDGSAAAGSAPEVAPARDDRSVRDLRESTQPETPEAEVAPKITDDPAPEKPPMTLRADPDGPLAAGAGRDDGGAERKSAAPGAVVRGVRWVALAVAALVVLVARFVGRSVRSGWLAASEWLRQSWEGRRSESKEKKAAQDEEFLDRLSSTVEKPEIEPPVSDEAKRR